MEMNNSLKSESVYQTLKPKKEKLRRSKAEKIIISIVFVLLCVYAFTLIYPFFYVLLNSFKLSGHFVGDPLSFKIDFAAAKHNYGFVFTEYNIFSMFMYSIILSSGQTAVGMALSCIAAYVLAKYKFRGNNFIYIATIVASMVPTVGAAPATYKLMGETGLNLIGTGFVPNYFGMLFMVGAFGGPFLYLHSFFKAIPWSYGESAQLDGASDFRIFVQIMLPLAANGVLTFTIMRFLGCWNEYWTANLYFGNYPTLAVGLRDLSYKADHFGNYCELFASMIVTIIPILIFYAIFQKQLMRNTIGGGLKG